MAAALIRKHTHTHTLNHTFVEIKEHEEGEKQEKRFFLISKITGFHSAQLQDTKEFDAAFFFCFCLSRPLRVVFVHFFSSLSLNESKTMRRKIVCVCVLVCMSCKNSR